MDLQRSKQMFTLLQRSARSFAAHFGHGSATADLMDANDPVRSNQLQHDQPLHSELPATTTGRSHSTPHLLVLGSYRLYVPRSPCQPKKETPERGGVGESSRFCCGYPQQTAMTQKV
jgi:hypothetical protein